LPSAREPSIGKVRREALRQIENARMPTEGFRSKNWDEFAQPGAPQMDFVFTVCDNAANEVCPVWPGQPMTAHWGVPDPATISGSSEEFERAFRERVHDFWTAEFLSFSHCRSLPSVNLRSRKKLTV